MKCENSENEIYFNKVVSRQLNYTIIKIALN